MRLLNAIRKALKWHRDEMRELAEREAGTKRLREFTLHAKKMNAILDELSKQGRG